MCIRSPRTSTASAACGRRPPNYWIVLPRRISRPGQAPAPLGRRISLTSLDAASAIDPVRGDHAGIGAAPQNSVQPIGVAATAGQVDFLTVIYVAKETQGGAVERDARSRRLG